MHGKLKRMSIRTEPQTFKSCQILEPALYAENSEEYVQIKTVTANTAEIMSRTGRGSIEKIESSDI